MQLKNSFAAKLFGSDENRACFDKKFSTKLLSVSDEATFEVSIRARVSKHNHRLFRRSLHKRCEIIVVPNLPKKKPCQKCIGLLFSCFLAEIKNARYLRKNF